MKKQQVLFLAILSLCMAFCLGSVSCGDAKIVVVDPPEGEYGELGSGGWWYASESEITSGTELWNLLRNTEWVKEGETVPTIGFYSQGRGPAKTFKWSSYYYEEYPRPEWGYLDVSAWGPLYIDTTGTMIHASDYKIVEDGIEGWFIHIIYSAPYLTIYGRKYTKYEGNYQWVNPQNW